MAFITLRQANVVNSPNATVKGSPLTNAEVDNNFANLNLTISGVANALANLSSSEISNGTSSISITLNGDATITANLVPSTSNTINLGSPTKRFGNLFLAGDSISLGADVISSVGGFIRINDNNVFTNTGNLAAVSGENINNINASNITSGTLAVTQGGTGVGTLTGIIKGNGTSAFTANATVDILTETAGVLSTGRGGTGNTTATFVNLVANVYNTLPVANGGTGNTAAAFASLTSNVYGILPAGNGGTGFNGGSASSGQLPIGNGSGFTANTITGTDNRITVTNGVGAITLTTPQDLHTTAQIQFAALNVGNSSSFGSTGDIRATNNITAFFSSDNKYKENVRDIDNALDKVNHIGGKYFDWTDSYIAAQGGADGYFMIKSDFGVIAQDVQEVFPVAVRARPDGSLAVDYEKLVSLAFAAIKELQAKVKKLEG